MPRKKVVEEEGVVSLSSEPTEKEVLLDLYEELKTRNIRSISDLEGQIARAE